MRPIRVLLAEDFEPFRQFVCKMLASRPHLHVIGEVSDGLEAVQRVLALKPDLILMDIGLPSLGGIAAARQIRKISPGSKIVFLSQESSPDVVQEAVSLDTCGYVLKAKARSDLFAAVDAVLDGVQFVSDGLLVC